MTYRNDFARCIAENIERGDKAYARDIAGWEKHIAFTITKALAAGLSVGVYDGEVTTLERCTDHETIMKALFSTDDDTLLFYREGEEKPFAWVWLVYGNGVDEVISDYTTNLDEIFMEEVNLFADTLI